MAIEVARKEAADSSEKTVLGYIEPDRIISMSDYSQAVRRVISIYCRSDDAGGEVYCFANKGFLQNNVVRIVPVDAYTPTSLEATIEYGGTYERTLTTEARDIAHIVFTHIPQQ